ncbi:hypothetical protein [Myceligenerans indicum]|uniref:Lipoprotein n=1 Tax=Myceligenerans indicum TaxID=2593663 RepID=A0ABS1LNW8_9MICO|nr:hypothetical protein [Myceligenerans indicum]MBL0887950.1 hypothetical protein [Myceligenerans indicum]
MTRKIKRLAGLAAVVVLGLALAACQGEPVEMPTPSVEAASPSPSPSPSADRAEEAIAERAAAAEKSYREYLKISAKYAQKGESPFWELNDNHYIAGDVAEAQQQSWESFELLEQKWVGAPSIESIEFAHFEGNPLREEITGQRVHFRVCLDNSKRDIVNPDGSSAILGGAERVLLNIALQGQPGGQWSFVKSEVSNEGC